MRIFQQQNKYWSCILNIVISNESFLFVPKNGKKSTKYWSCVLKTADLATYLFTSKTFRRLKCVVLFRLVPKRTILKKYVRILKLMVASCDSNHFA